MNFRNLLHERRKQNNMSSEESLPVMVGANEATVINDF